MLKGIGEFAAAVVMGLGALVVIAAGIGVLMKVLPW